MLRSILILAALALALAGCVAPPPSAPSIHVAEPTPATSPAARRAISEAGVSYLDRSLDKTIIVRRGRASTVPGRPGQGTRYVFVPRR